MALKAGANTCTMIFRGQDVDCGWSESWQTSTGDMNAAMDGIENVANKRIGILSARFSIEYLRVSKVQVPLVAPNRNQRISFLRKVNLGGSLDPTKDGDLPFVSASVRFYNADKTVFALRQLRGVPDDWWSDNDDKVAASKIKTPLNSYVTSLSANAMGVNHKVPAGGVALILVNTGIFTRMTHRQTGRPLYLSRGRRSAT